MLKIRRNIRLFKLNNFFIYMWPLSAVAIIYFDQITGSYASASLIFSTYILTQSLTELPTSLISDKWSRKKTLIMSGIFLILSGVCFAVAGNIHNISLLFIGATFWGIGDAFNSGTDEALIFETMKDLRKTEKYDIIFSTTKIYRWLGAALSTVIAVPVIYFLNLNILAWVSILPAVCQLVICFFFVEPSNYEPSSSSTLKHFMEALKQFKENKKLQKITIAQIMNYSWGETQYRLNSIYYNLFIPLWAVDIVVFIYRICSSIGFYFAIFMRKIGLFKMAFVSSTFKCITIFLGLLINNVLSPFIISASSLATGGEHSAESALLQKEFSDTQRATMRSIVAIFGGLLTTVSFYIFGLIADMYSIYTALSVLLCYKITISIYYWVLMKQLNS